MKISRLLFTLGFIFVLTISVFIIYTQFLVDYSLENLQFSLKATSQKNASDISPLVNSLYSTLVQDQVLQKVAAEKMDLSQLALMEMASRSFEEASFRNSYEGARLYLNQLVQNGIEVRNPVLRLMDSVNERLQGFGDRFTRYFRHRFESDTPGPPDQLANDLLLNHAKELEKKGEVKAAAELYRKYLTLYPGNSNRGFVSIALASLLIQQARLPEAETILDRVASSYTGLEEAALASRFLQKIDFLKRGTALLPRLKTLLGSTKKAQTRDALQMKLALTHISLFQLPQAEGYLNTLLSGKTAKIRSQAKFYLGWVYKLRRQYGESERILLDLLDDPDLAKDLELGLHAGLADIYYQQNEPQKALKQYRVLRKKSKRDIEDLKKSREESASKKATQEAWLGLSELETANIYTFNLNDSAQAAEYMEAAKASFGSVSMDPGAIQKEMQKTPETDLRTRAFRALEMRQISLAYELFTKNAVYQPADAWTFGGLSTIYVLLGDMNLALENAEHSYRLGNDEYTASALGYVYGLSSRYAEAATFYRQAIQLNGNYFPAKFNLSYNYLKLEEYEKALELLEELDRRFGNANAMSRAKIRNNMGYALWKTGKQEEAVRRFRESLEISPDFLIARKNLDFSKGSSPEAAA